MSDHKIKWWVYAWAPGQGYVEKMRRTSEMRGKWAYDVSCSCGWESRTGGAVRSYIENEIKRHKIWEGAA